MEDKRLTSPQRTALIMLICLKTLTGDCEEDLAVRIDDRTAWAGKADSAKSILNSMAEDVYRTMDAEQLQHLRKTARDYEIRLVPRMTPRTTNMVIDRETMRALIDASQNRCVDCYKTEAESRGCKLQRLLAILIPMKKYEDTGLCAFNNREWEN